MKLGSGTISAIIRPSGSVRIFTTKSEYMIAILSKEEIKDLYRLITEGDKESG